MEKANLKNDEDILEIFNSDIKVLKLGGEMRAVSYEVEVDEEVKKKKEADENECF